MLARLLIVNTAISPSSTAFRDIRAVEAAISGAPTTTPSAYAEITCPAVGSEIAKLDAISGSNPIATNSVVPMPNPPKASASTASHRTDGAGATTETGVEGRSSAMVTNVGPFLWSDVGNGNETFGHRQTDLGFLTAKVRQVTIEDNYDPP